MPATNLSDTLGLPYMRLRTAVPNNWWRVDPSLEAATRHLHISAAAPDLSSEYDIFDEAELHAADHHSHDGPSHRADGSVVGIANPQDSATAATNDEPEADTQVTRMSLLCCAG